MTRHFSSGLLPPSTSGWNRSGFLPPDWSDDAKREWALEAGNVAKFLQSAREFLYGMIGYEFEQHALELRSSMESLFMAILFGDMLGLPIMPPYYSLHVLPYVVPSVATWKRRVSREREFGEDHEFDLHGI